MAFAGVKKTPVKKVLKQKSALSCRLCGATVTNGGYYSLTLDRTSFPGNEVASDTPEKFLKYLFENSSLFRLEENLSVGPRFLCKKSFRRIERFEVTMKELSSFKSRLMWKEEGEEASSKRCSSSPGFGVKKSRGPSSQSATSVVPGSSGKNIRRAYDVPVMGCYSTQSELARHDSRAHVQQLTLFSTTPACFARHATRDVNVTFALTSSLKHNMNKEKETK